MRQCRCNFSYQFREKNPVCSFEKCPFLVQARKTIILHLIIHFSLYYLSSGRLWEVKNKGKLKTFSSKSGRGRLQEVPNVVIWLGNFWYFGKLVAEERWSLTRGGRNWRFDCSSKTPPFWLHDRVWGEWVQRLLWRLPRKIEYRLSSHFLQDGAIHIRKVRKNALQRCYRLLQ